MELRDAVDLFATEVFSDVFNPLVTFTGKLNPFAEVTNSGSSSRRRILETPRDQVIPAARVIEAASGEKFVVADVNVDYWDGEIIRYKYPTYPSDSVGSVGTIGQTLAGTQPDTTVYAYPFFVGREADAEERSDYLSRFELYFSRARAYTRGEVLLIDGHYYRLKSDTTVDGAGFAVAFGIKLENPVQVFTIIGSGTVYDSTIDGYVTTTTTGVACFVEPLMQDYEFVTPSFTKIEAGDLAISVLKSSLTVAVNDWIGTYKVLSIRDAADYVICQCRNMVEAK